MAPIGMMAMSPCSATGCRPSAGVVPRGSATSTSSSAARSRCRGWLRSRSRHSADLRMAFSMTAMSAWASKGLVIASIAPVCCTKWSRMRSDFALIRTIGRVAQQLVVPDRAAELEAVHLRHDEVDQDDVDLLGLVSGVFGRAGRVDQLLERGVPVGRLDGLEPVPFEDRAHDLANGRAVVDDEDAGAHARCRGDGITYVVEGAWFEASAASS